MIESEIDNLVYIRTQHLLVSILLMNIFIFDSCPGQWQTVSTSPDKLAMCVLAVSWLGGNLAMQWVARVAKLLAMQHMQIFMISFEKYLIYKNSKWQILDYDTIEIAVTFLQLIVMFEGVKAHYNAMGVGWTVGKCKNIWQINTGPSKSCWYWHWLWLWLCVLASCRVVQQ